MLFSHQTRPKTVSRNVVLMEQLIERKAKDADSHKLKKSLLVN